MAQRGINRESFEAAASCHYDYQCVCADVHYNLNSGSFKEQSMECGIALPQLVVRSAAEPARPALAIPLPKHNLQIITRNHVCSKLTSLRYKIVSLFEHWKNEFASWPVHNQRKVLAAGAWLGQPRILGCSRQCTRELKCEKPTTRKQPN